MTGIPSKAKLHGPTSSSSPKHTLSRSHQTALERTLTSDSSHTSHSTYTLLPPHGTLSFSLQDVGAYISSHPSLSRALILATECYAVRSGAVTHRFLVLELSRPERKAVWMRLDRFRAESVGILKFFSASGVTKANDRVSLLAWRTPRANFWRSEMIV